MPRPALRLLPVPCRSRAPQLLARGRLPAGPNGASRRSLVAAGAAAADAAAPAPAPARVSPFINVLLPTALALLLCNMDRICLSVAIMPMAAEFGWPASLQVGGVVVGGAQPPCAHACACVPVCNPASKLSGRITRLACAQRAQQPSARAPAYPIQTHTHTHIRTLATSQTHIHRA